MEGVVEGQLEDKDKYRHVELRQLPHNEMEQEHPGERLRRMRGKLSQDNS